MGFGIKSKLKRRNLEKRKEKSRDAARTRRSRETEIFLSLSKEIPISFSLLSQMDKASVIRLTITHLKIRNFCEQILKRKKAVQTFPSVDLENKLNKLYYKSINGFVMVISNTGNLIFTTESIMQHLGLSQVDLLGHNVFDFVHPCDHSELRDICGINKPNSSNDMKGSSFQTSLSLLSQEGQQKRNFFIRMRCIHPCKGRSLSPKTNAYKVIHCSGFLIPYKNEQDTSMSFSQEDLSFLVIECDSILHPSNQNIRLDSRSFISHHTMDMKFIYCDEGVSSLLGYSPEQLIGTCIYEFHHALDNSSIASAYKTLFSKGQSVTGLYRFLARSGGYAWVQTQASLVKNPQTDIPQSVICISSVVTGILCEEEIFGVVQQPTFKPLCSKEESIEHFNHVNVSCDLKTDSKQCLYDKFMEPVMLMTNEYHNEDVEVESMLCKEIQDDSNVMFSTEKILNSSKIFSDDKAASVIENEMQPYLDSLHSSAGGQNVDTSLPNVSSNASLYKPLKEFDDDGDEMRAPFIPMDDLIFADNTSDGTFLTTIEEDDIPVFATESIDFDDISNDMIPNRESPNVLEDHRTQGDGVGYKNLKEEGYDDIQSSSVLKNLLVKGEDTNYGYRLMTGNQHLKYEKINVKSSKVSTLYHLLCS